jgi:hypothetical protein
MLALVKGSDYDGAAVSLIFGVAAPILLLAARRLPAQESSLIVR